MNATIGIIGGGNRKMSTLMNALTNTQVDDIVKAMDENLKESPNLQDVADLPSNNGIEVHEREDGHEEKVTVTIDPNTGVTIPTAENQDEDSVGMDFDDLVNQAIKNLDEKETKVDITEDDIEDQIKKNDEYFKDFELSRDGIVQILKIVKAVQDGEKINVFKSFPVEVQQKLNKYLSKNGVGGYSAEANRMRNTLADMIINEFISNISMDKFNLNFQKEMEELENKVNKEFSKMYLDYSEQREEYVRSIMNDETDDIKKEAIGKILDSIHDGFALERIKENASRIKVKKYDVENPKRSFDMILNKYRDSTYNIYSVYTACSVLQRHMKKLASKEDIQKFFVVICKFCQNYHPSDPTQHAFMYYAMYNPILLDVYKGDEYEKFFNEYSKNVMDVINIISNRTPSFERKAMTNLVDIGRGSTNPCTITYD